MANGALYSGKCFASQPEAVDAYYSSYSPNVTAGSTSYYVYFTKDGSNWLSVTSSKTATGQWVDGTPVNASAPTFPVCDTTASFIDGLAIGWGIAGVMAIAWGFRKIQEKLR